MTVKITTLVSGARALDFQMRAAVPFTRARLREGIQETTAAVLARARANAPVSNANSRKAKRRPGPGELRDTIRDAYGKDGLSGYVLAGYGKLPRRSRSKRAPKLGPMRLAAFQRQQKRETLKALRDLGVYAMVINYGSPGRGIHATHFMDRAKEAERTAHIQRMQRALKMTAEAFNTGSLRAA